MAEVAIHAEIRSDFGSGASRKIRRSGRIPGIVYGGDADNLAVTVDPKELFKVLRTGSGRNTILNLDITGAKGASVILKDWQVDPVRENMLHADFQRIAMDVALRVTVPIAFRGEAYGVKTEGGVLEVILREVAVECLPADIPDRLECNVSELKLHESIRIGDLQAPDRVEILDEPDQVVVHVISVREEAAAAPAEGEGAPAAPEVLSKGKKEEGGE